MPKIRDLPLASAADDAGLLPCSVGGTTVRVSISQLRSFLLANTALAGLSDVTVSSPTAGQVVRFNGTRWINAALNVADIGASGTPDNTKFLRGDGLWAVPPSGGTGATAFSALSDVVLTSPAAGQVARYNGSNWVNASLGVADINATGTRNSSTYLTGAGTWAAPAIPAASSTTPAVNGTAAIGTAATYARADHVHPTDASRAAASAIPVASSTTPAANGTAAIGTGTTFARADHAHPQYIPTFPVEKYGAVGNGTTDDTAAIQAAINAAALVGGDVLFGPKTYKISSTLLVGDGSASAVSTYSGVRLVGTGVPPKPATMFSGYGALTKKVTYLRWSGTIGGTMLRIRGPLQGWGLQNLFFDGGNGLSDFGGRAGIGVEVISAMSGDNRNLSFSGCRIGSIYLTTVPLITGVSITDAIHNSWDNINIGQGWADGSKAIVMTGATSTTNSNSDFNKFTNVTIALPGTMGAGEVGYGLYFQSCDSHSFTNVHFFNGDPSFPAMVFDYTVTDIWPAGNQIMGVDWGAIPAPIQQKGTPNANARPNYITLVSECNGGFLPTGIANLTVDGHIMRTADIIGLTTSQVNKILWSPFRAGLYRLNYYAVVTGGNAGGGSITLSFAWNDGSGAHSVNSAVMLNSAGNYVSGVISMYLAIPSDVAWAATLSGINGTTVTTQYRVALAVDRMF